MTRFAFLAVILSVSLAPLHAAQGKGKGQAKGKGKGHDKETVVVFEPVHRTTIVDYYRAQPGGLPPGLARRGDLPPGLEKQLRRNGRLPPGLEKKLVPFPQELEARLPPPPPDTRRGMIGGAAVLLNIRTGLIVDVAVLF